MNNDTKKRTMKTPAAFVGRRVNPDKWNIPAGYGLCRMTQKLHHEDDLLVTFAHWKFEKQFLLDNGIYVEDAEWLSEAGYDLIMDKLEALGMTAYYVEYPALPFPGSQPEASDEDDSAALIDGEIAATVDCIRQAQQQAERIATNIYDMKNTLESLLKTRGSNWTDDDGYARLAAPGVRVNYRREELDALILQDPVKYAWLKQYRHESTVAGRVVVK